MVAINGVEYIPQAKVRGGRREGDREERREGKALMTRN
jgi:hypothetical protein